MGNSSLTTINQITWETLREEGLRHLQSMTGHLWADYNIHDPGVTIFEVLCYAISDLNSRLSLNIADILADGTALADSVAGKQFFSPGEILTVNPVTVNDYRKLLIDVPGVKNAWLVPATDTDPTLYYDKDNNALLYGYAPEAERIGVNGLYRVYIEKDEQITDDNELKRRVAEKLHAHRNLGEDFAEINVMEQETIAVYSDIQIAENANPDKVMAQIYFDLKNFISPRVKQYSLKRMLQKGKSMEQIFNGPQLEHGFIDDDELGAGEKRKELHTSDLIRIIMACPEVKDVRNLFISNVPNPDMRDKKEWALVVDDTKALIMDPLNTTKIRLFQNDTMCPVILGNVMAELQILQTQSEREIFDDPSMDLTETLGEASNLTGFQPLAHLLPSVYGVGETGLPLAASAKRRAQAKQLKAYLLFFEQILVNYLRQLDSFKQLFAFRQNGIFYPVQVEFTRRINAILSRRLDLHQPVTGDAFTSIDGIDQGLSQTIVTRLKTTGLMDDEGNVLHTITEEAVDFVIPVIEAVIINKMRETNPVSPYLFTGIPGINDALSNEIWTRLKNKGYINDAGTILSTFVPDQDGFTLDLKSTDDLKTYYSQLPPAAVWQEDFANITAGYEYTEKDAREDAFQRKNRILNHLLAQFNEKFADYALFGFANSDYLNAKAGFLKNYPGLSRNRNRAYNVLTPIPNPQVVQYTDGLRDLIAAKLGLEVRTLEPADWARPDNFFIVEHILFRPDGTLPLDFICSEKIAENFQPDPYSYQLTFVIPKKTGRFKDNKFKELVYATIANETPAHISYTILEFESGPMNEFTTIYRNFLWELHERRMGRPNQYNFRRSQLMEFLGIGRVKLPVLHLDAHQVNGDAINPGDQAPIAEWKDLSRNNHHATTSSPVKPEFIKNGSDGLPWVKFPSNTRLVIENSLIQDDFSIVVVYKASASGVENEPVQMLAGDGSSFMLGFRGNGTVTAGLDNAAAPITMNLESTMTLPHLAIFTREKATGEFRLSLDGVFQTTQIVKDANQALTHSMVIIGPGEGVTGSYELGEVIILDSPLTGSRKQKLEKHLSAKWNIPLSAAGSIAAPVLHLDAADSNSVIRDQNTRVSRWKDLSPAGTDATIGDTSLQPPEYITEGIADLPALKFNETSLVIPDLENQFFNGDFTIVMVYQAYAGEGSLLDRTAGEADQDMAIRVESKGDILFQRGTETLKLPATLRDTHMVIVSSEVIDNQLQMTLSLDGKAFTSKTVSNMAAPGNSPGELLIGQSKTGLNSFSGKVAEIIIYQQALPVLNRQRLEQFLAAKWRIDISGVAEITAPLLHLDAARLATVLDENNTVINDRNIEVSRWTDLSYHGNDAVQNNGNRRPRYTLNGIHGLGAVWFTQENTGSDIYEDSLTIAPVISRDFTVMMVFQPDTAYYNSMNNSDAVTVSENSGWTQGVALLDADCSGFYYDFGLSFGKSNGQMIVMGGIGDRLTGDHTIKTRGLEFEKPHLITFTRLKTTGEVKLFADGLLHAQVDLRDEVILNDSRAIKIGAFNSEGIPFHGMMGEIIIFDTVLPDEKRQRIEKYLATKWDIPLTTLPIDTEGLCLHLDAVNHESIVAASSGKVSRWLYRKGLNEISAIQEHSGSQPVYIGDTMNGMPGIGFNNNFMNVALHSTATDYDDFTVAMVYKPQSGGNISPGWEYGAGLIDNYEAGTANHFGIAMSKNNELIARIGTQSIKAPVSLNCPHIAVITRQKNTGNVNIYMDGLLVKDGRISEGIAVKIAQLTIGAIRTEGSQTVSKGYYQGDLAELVFFNKVLPTAERQMLEKHLSLKWNIDISGINRIAKPVLHLDAGQITMLVKDQNQKISRWLDVNGHSNHAEQTDPAKQPVYRESAFQGLGAIHFDGANHQCLTLKPVVKDDFTVIIVYNADSQINVSQFKPVSEDSFTMIAGIDNALSAEIWSHLCSQHYIDGDGNVLPAFNPGQSGFSLNLSTDLYRMLSENIENRISGILDSCITLTKPVAENAFTVIGGIDQTLSQTIRAALQQAGYINSSGYVTKHFEPDTESFITPFIGTAIINLESAIIDVVLAENWIAGAGLFDGNCAGTRAQKNQRDFGVLIGKSGDQGTFMAGIGVPDEGDYQIKTVAPFGQPHIGIFTRKKDTGMVKLFVDNQKPEQARVAMNVTLKDSDRFTIGAVNTGGNYFTGDIAEIVVLAQVPPDEKIAEIRDYLARKWKINL